MPRAPTCVSANADRGSSRRSLTRVDPASAVPCVDRRRLGQRAGRRRPRSVACAFSGSAVAGLEAPSRRRAGLWVRREDRPTEQARPAARRLQLHDVEQRHVRVRDRHRSDLRVDPVLSWCCAGGRTHGIFLDNTFRSNFDIGHTSPGLLAFGAEGGELNYYFIDGPDPKRRHPALHRA